jgi:hypothetical protein
MRKTLLFLYLLSLGSITAYGQTRLTQDPKLERQLHESGLIHQPLPLDIENSFEANGWKKEVLQSAPLTCSAGTEGWSHSGAGSMSFSTEKSISGKGSIKLQFPTSTGKRATGSPSDPDYATYGNSSVTYHLCAPGNEGLFQKAIVQSFGGITPHYPPSAFPKNKSLRRGTYRQHEPHIP